MRLSPHFRFIKYLLIMVVALFLSQGLKTTVFVSGTPQINTTFIADIRDKVTIQGLLTNVIAYLNSNKNNTPSIAKKIDSNLTDETKANLVNVTAVAPRVVEDGIEIREYGNVAQITIPRKLLEDK